mmetsp:Transcript_7464/g.17396  ORF Transcript_7464/g.17396 Transcript_7464/m.17396 type:complete len:330 (-) Transcript_7464:180-1169(-)
MPNPSYGCICGWQDCQKFHKFFKGRKDHPWSGKLLKLSYEPDSNLWKSVCNFIEPSPEKKAELQTRFDDKKGAKAGSGRQKVTSFRLARHHYSFAVLSLKGYWTAPIPIEVARKRNCYPGRTLHSDKKLRFDTRGKSDDWRKKYPGTLLVKAPENACINVREEYMKLRPIDSAEASGPANEVSQSRVAKEAAKGRHQTRRRREEEERRQEYTKLQSIYSAEVSRLENEVFQKRSAKEAEERHQKTRQGEEEERRREEEQRLVERERREEEDRRRTPAQWKALFAAKDAEIASKSAEILSLRNELSSAKRRLDEISTSKKKGSNKRLRAM